MTKQSYRLSLTSPRSMREPRSSKRASALCRCIPRPPAHRTFVFPADQNPGLDLYKRPAQVHHTNYHQHLLLLLFLTIMQEIHLLVAAHGMWGEPAHLAEMARIIQESYPVYDLDGQDDPGSGIKLNVLVAQTNTLDSTYDGMDWGGERIADEVCLHATRGARQWLTFPSLLIDTEEDRRTRKGWNAQGHSLFCSRIQSRRSPSPLSHWVRATTLHS
jgi:hypothetical protein